MNLQVTPTLSLDIQAAKVERCEGRVWRYSVSRGLPIDPSRGMSAAMCRELLESFYGVDHAEAVAMMTTIRQTAERYTTSSSYLGVAGR